MTKSKKTYKLNNALPAYTVEQWLDTYKLYLAEIYSTPIKSRKGQMWDDFIKFVNEIQSFLKDNGVKFI